MFHSLMGTAGTGYIDLATLYHFTCRPLVNHSKAACKGMTSTESNQAVN